MPSHIPVNENTTYFQTLSSKIFLIFPLFIPTLHPDVALPYPDQRHLWGLIQEILTGFVSSTKISP
jgi:hypothetical protein